MEQATELVLSDDDAPGGGCRLKAPAPSLGGGRQLASRSRLSPLVDGWRSFDRATCSIWRIRSRGQLEGDADFLQRPWVPAVQAIAQPEDLPLPVVEQG